MVDLTNMSNMTAVQMSQMSGVVQSFTPSPGWVQSIGGMITGLFATFIPAQYLWLVPIAIAIGVGGFVVRQLRQGALTFTALWIICSIMAFLALKYIGL